MSDAEVDEVMRRFRGRGRISLSELLEPLGVDKDERRRARDEGLITPLPGKRGRGGSYVVDEDEAARLVRAALIAAAVGMSIVIVLRVLGAAGGDVGTGTVMGC